jgi:phosphoglycolate phosphatase
LKRYPAYLFDLDGTLVDTAPDINAALNRTLVAAGYPAVDEALTRHWVGFGVRALVIQALERHGLPEARTDDLVEVFIGHYEAEIAVRSQPYPGVVEALQTLREGGARLGVVTNKRAQFTEPLLEALRLDGYFDTVVSGDTAAEPKPAPIPALYACEVLRTVPSDALFVGDSDTDVRCARAAGCPVVVVRDGYNHGTPATELGADAVIDSFLELV